MQMLALISLETSQWSRGQKIGIEAKSYIVFERINQRVEGTRQFALLIGDFERIDYKQTNGYRGHSAMIFTYFRLNI